MTDEDLHTRIEELAHEEHRLRSAHAGTGLTDAEKARLSELEVALDKAWDLLRQREARRDAGQDPGLAQERSTSTVEGYLG
ncbi:MAG TPA: DUF2630 family protein [Mycobacteriales bacterium]|nr:DUF2630 family protein [Mycobacteriales bacterium]